MTDEVGDSSSQVVEKGFIVAESYQHYHFKGAFQFDPDIIWAPTFGLCYVRKDYPMIIEKRGKKVQILSQKEEGKYAISFMHLLPFPDSDGGVVRKWDKVVLPGGFVSKEGKILNDTSILHDADITNNQEMSSFFNRFEIEEAYEATLQQIPTRFYDWVRRIHPFKKSSVNNLEGMIILSPESAGKATAWAIRTFEKNRALLTSSTPFKYLPPNNEEVPVYS